MRIVITALVGVVLSVGVWSVAAPADEAGSQPASRPTSRPVPKEVAVAIDDGITLLEAQQYEALLDKFVEPARLKEWRGKGEMQKRIDEFKQDKAAMLLKVLKAARGQNAFYNETGEWLRIEVEGLRALKFMKVEGKWCLK